MGRETILRSSNLPLVLILVLATLLCGWRMQSASAQVVPGQRAAVPPAESQKKTAKLLEDTYNLARLENMAKKQEVVKKLVEASRDKTLPAADRYVVLTTVISLAKETADFNSYLEAINSLVGAFEVDANKEKTRLLAEFLEASKPGTLLKLAAVEEALAIARVAAHENRYADTNSLLSAAEGAVRRATGASGLIKVVAETRDAIAVREKDWRAFQTASTKLVTNADDPAANVTVGRWHLLQQADWKTALPFLAKVSQAKWKAAAELERTAPLDPLVQAAVGDAWWEIGQEESGATKTALLIHAGEWYARAQSSLTSAVKKQLIAKRLDDIVPLKAAATNSLFVPQDSPHRAPGEWIDLLDWAVGVDWAPRGIDWNQYLDGPATKEAINLKALIASRFPLPAIIDGDYELEVEFTRHDTLDTIEVYFPVGAHNL